MKSKITESDITDLFKKSDVYTSVQFLEHFGCTYQCFWNHMRTLDYYSSYTHNSKYYTLSNIVEFDQNGICFIDDPREGKIGFSKYGTSKGLVVSLVNSSEHGMSEKEISNIMKVRVSNQLNTLTGRGKIKKIRLDGRYRYYSNNAKLENSSKSDNQDKDNIHPANEHETTLSKAMESRDKWRERSNIYRKTIKLLSLKIRDLTNSREKWKQKTEDYKKQSRILQSELMVVKKTSSQK